MTQPRQHLKTGHFYCEAVLEHRREQGCAFCRASPPSEPQHWPPKRMGGGLIDDLKTVSVCRDCHRRCEGTRIATASGYRMPIGKEEQDAAVGAALHDFLFNATRERLDAFADALLEHRGKRGL